MKTFKFLQKNTEPEMDLVEMVSQEVQRIARSPEYIPAGYVYTPYIPLQITEPRGINACIMQGYRAHRDNLPPGQCPYDIGTPEREHWMTGWSARENREPLPDELHIELTDTDTGENFRIPSSIHTEISIRGRNFYNIGRTTSGRCEYNDDYSYWIENVYRTIEDTLVIEVAISVPYNHLIRNRIRYTFHKVRLIIPYETI